MKRASIIFLAIFSAFLLMGAAFRVEQVEAEKIAHEEWTEKQIKAHLEAELWRAMGLPEDHPLIQAAKDKWWEDYKYWEAAGISWTDYCSWCRMVDGECGDGSDRETPENVENHKLLRLYTAAVLGKRMESDAFPNTAVECLRQEGQYNPDYVCDNLDGIAQENIDAVNTYLSGNFQCPDDTWWQAQFPQGKETVAVITVDTGWWTSTTWICRG